MTDFETVPTNSNAAIAAANKRHRADLPEGWKAIFDRLIEQFSQLDPQPRVDQAKEKFGTLRVYVDEGDEEVTKLVEAAIMEAGRTCDVCGCPGIKNTSARRIVAVRCQSHDVEN